MLLDRMWMAAGNRMTILYQLNWELTSASISLIPFCDIMNKGPTLSCEVCITYFPKNKLRNLIENIQIT